MRNFLKLAQNVNVIPIVHAIYRQPELWNQFTLRSHYPNSPHNAADDIWLRFNDKGAWENNSLKVMNERECVNYPAWDKLPQIHNMVFDLMRTVEGTRLGRVVVTRLIPGKSILPHVDGGEYADYYDRYHVTLQNAPGANFRAGDDVICPQPGEVYWFNRLAEHEVINHSNDDRITLIVDIRCNK